MSNDVRDIYKKINELSVDNDDTMNVGDSFDIELSESFVIETGIVGFTEDGVIVEADESMLEFLDFNGVLVESEELEELEEAEYQGRKVPLGKPMQGDVAKFKVYVKKPDGKVVKVNFGDKNMRIKKSNPARRKSFRARHSCDNPGPRWKARFWSCKAW
jgi:hypothetical protein